MRALKVVQGSADWFSARLGKPTASRFSEILTPTGKLSASADGYMHELLSERLLGFPFEAAGSGFMDRGSNMEAEAVAWYQIQRWFEVEKVGFCLRDDGRVGCSPDRLVGADGVLEIKVPNAPNHVMYMLDGFPRKYWPQVQGQLWITGRKWADCMSYSPELPAALVRIDRDEAYIEALSFAVEGFLTRLDEAEARLRAMME